MKIAGRITSEENPLSDAKIYLRIGEENVAMLLSDDRGNFVFQVSDIDIGKILHIRVEMEGHETKSLPPLRMEREDINRTVDLRLLKLFVIGRVKSNGSPLSGATIRLHIGTRAPQKVFSNESGEIKYQTVGDYRQQSLTCRISKLGFKSQEVVRRIEGYEVDLGNIDLGPPWWDTALAVIRQRWKMLLGIVAAIIVGAVIIVWLASDRTEPLNAKQFSQAGKTQSDVETAFEECRHANRHNERKVVECMKARGYQARSPGN